MQSRNSNNSQGIDISKWQGSSIDWNKVKNTNIKFVIIKASESTGTVDSRLNQNYSGAKNVGIPLGFYHFAHVSNDPILEAEHYLESVKDYSPELWHVLDLENGSLDGKTFTKSQVSTWAKKWLEKVESVTGKVPMIYTGASFARSCFESDLSRYPLWVAHYGAETPMSNSVWDTWTMFQFSESGKVDGIAGNVDLNEFNGNIDDFLSNSEDEEDMNKILEYEQWAWDELNLFLGDAYNDKIIEEWKWVQAARDKTLTYKDLLLLKVLIDERRRAKL